MDDRLADLFPDRFLPGKGPVRRQGAQKVGELPTFDDPKVDGVTGSLLQLDRHLLEEIGCCGELLALSDLSCTSRRNS